MSISRQPAPVHVRVADDALVVDGQARFFFGGELQYFRVRDADFDGPRTWDLWARRLDQLAAAGITLISTYIPWDYHAPEAGRFDFEGARALRRFLDLAAARGLSLIVKPGPHILAEWPYGFGTWGAIPNWWTKGHPKELVRDHRGRIFRWHPLHPALGSARGALPSYASERFLDDVRTWFAALLPCFAEHLGPGGAVVALQLDNETNLFWSDMYRIDHHPAALGRYRESLRRRYGDPATLAQVYGSVFADFDSVSPPRRPSGDAHDRDWVAHQQQMAADFQGAIRALWEDLGVREPDLLFITNDTPQSFPGLRDLLLPHGPTKNLHGLHCLDSYPRALPLPGKQLFDNLFEPDFHAKLLDRWNDLYRGPSRFSMGIEIQGGHFSLPLPPHGLPWKGPRRVITLHHIRPEATRQTLLRLCAHGMKTIVLYTLVGGLNLDGSDYDFQAALKLKGLRTRRFEEIEQFAALLREFGGPLLRSQAIESSLAILANSAQLGGGGGQLGEQRIFGEELRALFGWCACAGFTPAVSDLAIADAPELAAYQVLLFPCSGRLGRAEAAKLEAYVQGGGTLVQLLHPGPLTGLFPGGVRGRSLTGGRARVQARIGDWQGSFPLPRRGALELGLPADGETLLRVGKTLLGYQRNHGAGRAVLLSSAPRQLFGHRQLYRADPLVLREATAFLQALVAPAQPLFACGGRDEAHARIDPQSGSILVFVLANQERGLVHLRCAAGLGLEQDRQYAVDFLLGAGTSQVCTGAQLEQEGLHLELGPFGAVLLRLSQR